jgi:formamidopyrimidine-DNA glycosylase
VLKEAIASGGITQQPFCAEDRFTGGFLPKLKVYGREGELCARTGLPIEKIDVSGRKAYASPALQPINE